MIGEGNGEACTTAPLPSVVHGEDRSIQDPKLDVRASSVLLMTVGLVHDDGQKDLPVDSPRVAGRRWVSVAHSIDGSYLEGVDAIIQPGIGPWAGAGTERAAVQPALEGRPGLGAGEAEAGIGAAARVVRVSGDGGIRRDRVDGPGVAGRRRVAVARGTSGAHLEGMLAVGQPAVRLRAGARTERSSIQPALECRPGLCAGEAEAGAGTVARVVRLVSDGGIRLDRVDGPRVGGRRRVKVAGSIDGPHLEGMLAVGPVSYTHLTLPTIYSV